MHLLCILFLYFVVPIYEIHIFIIISSSSLSVILRNNYMTSCQRCTGIAEVRTRIQAGLTFFTLSFRNL